MEKREGVLKIKFSKFGPARKSVIKIMEVSVMNNSFKDSKLGWFRIERILISFIIASYASCEFKTFYFVNIFAA